MRRTSIVLVASVAACAADGAPAPATTTTVTTTTTTTVERTTTTTTLDEEGISELELLAPNLLVTAEELGEGFTDTGFVPDEAGVCGVDEPEPDALVGASYESAEGTEFVQVIRIYAGTAAAEVFAALGAAVDCYPIGPDDVSESVGAPALAFDHSAGGGSRMVVVHIADAVVTFTVFMTIGLDVDAVAAFGAGKILAALGQ